DRERFVGHRVTSVPECAAAYHMMEPEEPDVPSDPNELIAQADVQKMEWAVFGAPEEMEAKVEDLAAGRIAEAVEIADKAQRNSMLSEIKQEVRAAIEEEFAEFVDHVGGVLESIEARYVRENILAHRRRIDGRDPDTVRPITCDLGLIPRAHGSSLFTRGETQALVSTTLGSVSDEQRLDPIEGGDTSKSFMLHYNFPSFSVGEVRPIRGVSRREIGHGALAERALQALLPTYEEFPYTMRLVSEILESNGSSSMATVCGGSLALMDAGVPLRAACAGVAMGLIKEGDQVAILTDILGAEDHLGDMDFKVAGSRKGVTSIQMDIKIAGLDLELMRNALQKAQVARIHILDIMDAAIDRGRESLSQYAPRIITVQVKPDRIGDIIGPKGKTIRGIQEETGADINIDDNGTVTISSVNAEGGERAREIIQGMITEPEVGTIYEGTVKSTTAFGAFVEILPGTEGLLHISELQHERTAKTEDVVKKGDTVRVKLLAVDDRGKLKLSRKALLEKPAGSDDSQRSDRGPKHSRHED
ncbi:MAG: polyribonucleotide nucleotidyltransferase, partial [Gemmatimonadales bacterium]